jgi:hypothetical protein
MQWSGVAARNIKENSYSFPRSDAMSKTTQNSPTALFTVIDGISTEDLLVNLTETLASAHALACDFAFDLEGARREGALDDMGPPPESEPGKF